MSVVAHSLAPEEAAAVGDLIEIALTDADQVDELDDGDPDASARSDEVEERDELLGDVDPDEDVRWSTPDLTDSDLEETTAPAAGRARVIEVVAPGLPPELAALDAVRGFEVFLGILGPVGLWGGAKPLVRSKAVELVVYLALHPRKPIDAERLMDVLWPGWQMDDAPAGKRHPTATTLNTTTTVARGCLGRAPDGQLYLPHLQGNGTRYYGLDGIGLDYQIFCDLMHQARLAESAGDAEAIAGALRAGLELVRGVPFEGLVKEDDETKPYQWIFVEGVFYAVERDVADSAHRLAVLRLAANDAEEASWAARRGLLACPGNRLLAHDLMLAGGMGRNPGAVEAALRELGDLVEQDEPYDRVDAETMALYREQMARAMSRSTHDLEPRQAEAKAAPSNGHHPGRPSLVNR
jgi:DNA-binding SARP family transcriptional activator